jgi:glucose uptake protein GlcU
MKMNEPRALFTDGWNSFWHIIFGAIATYNIIIAVVFVAYQFHNPNDKNLWVHIIEFIIGYFVWLVIITNYSLDYLRRW